MKQVVIENPVINSAFKEPSHHFLFTEDGITDEIVESRRTSAYFVPIAPPKKKGKQGIVERCRPYQKIPGFNQLRML